MSRVLAFCGIIQWSIYVHPTRFNLDSVNFTWAAEET